MLGKNFPERGRRRTDVTFHKSQRKNTQKKEKDLCASPLAEMAFWKERKKNYKSET